jgi:hypothetical protein
LTTSPAISVRITTGLYGSKAGFSFAGAVAVSPAGTAGPSVRSGGSSSGWDALAVSIAALSAEGRSRYFAQLRQ